MVRALPRKRRVTAMTGSLLNRTVLVTRAEEDAPAWVAALEARGARVSVLPCIRCEPIRDAETASRLRAALETADWLVLTSRRGVEAAAEIAGGAVSEERPYRIAVVGPATESEAVRRFGRVDLTAAQGTGASLARELESRPEGGGRRRIVVAAADRARRHLEEALEPAGHEVVRVAVYRTVPAPPRTPRVDLDALGVDTILLASPSAVEGLLHQAAFSKERTAIISIGPSTTEAARAAGLEVTGEADRPTLEGLFEVIEK